MKGGGGMGYFFSFPRHCTAVLFVPLIMCEYTLLVATLRVACFFSFLLQGTPRAVAWVNNDK